MQKVLNALFRVIARVFGYIEQPSEKKGTNCSRCKSVQAIDPDEIWNYGVGDKVLYRQAKSGEVEAQYLVGYYFWQGENGFEQNRLKAEDWLKKASQQGHLKAQEVLAKIRNADL